MNNTDILDFGKAVRNAQKCTYIRQADIARELGVRPQTVARWVKAKDIKLSVAIRIASVFNERLSDFLAKYSNQGWDYNE